MTFALAISTPACSAISGFGELEKADCAGAACDDASLDTASADTTVEDVHIDSSPDSTDLADSDSDAPNTGDSSTPDTSIADSGTSDTSTPDTSAPDTSIPDTGTLDTGTPDTSADAGGCVSTAGPTMVKAGPFCIDSTEVTNGQYKAFLAATPGAQPSYCSFNTSYVPAAGWPYAAGRDNYPVTNVDWCDAYAYCKWAGKRLCGKVGGGTNGFDPAFATNTSQWYYACGGGTGSPFPYGPAYVAMRCEDLAVTPNQLVPVATKTMCVGGFPGLYDMSGNAMELEDSCEATAGETDHCRVRGGSFDGAWTTDSDSLRCDAPNWVQRNSTWPFVGFRCCGP